MLESPKTIKMRFSDFVMTLEKKSLKKLDYFFNEVLK